MFGDAFDLCIKLFYGKTSHVKIGDGSMIVYVYIIIDIVIN